MHTFQFLFSTVLNTIRLLEASSFLGFMIAGWVPIRICRRKQQNPLVSLNRKRVIGSSEISKKPGESDGDVQKDNERRKKPRWKMSRKHRARRKVQPHHKSELEKVPQHCLPPLKSHDNRYWKLELPWQMSQQHQETLALRLSEDAFSTWPPLTSSSASCHVPQVLAEPKSHTVLAARYSFWEILATVAWENNTGGDGRGVEWTNLQYLSHHHTFLDFHTFGLCSVFCLWPPTHIFSLCTSLFFHG